MEKNCSMMFVSLWVSKKNLILQLEELNRDLYIRGEIWNVGDVVKTTDGDEGTIIRKGTNYVVFEDLRRVWLHNLEEVRKNKTR